MQKTFIITGALFLLLSVVLGAFGAHALKDVLSPDQLSTWHTAVQYQMIHGLGLAVVGTGYNIYHQKTINLTYWLMTFGVVFFSGSLYGLMLLSGSIRGILGPLTPLGGILMIASWVVLIIATLKK